jgi:hypothetical protein
MTEVSVVPVTVAANCNVPSTAREPEVGDIDTAIFELVPLL